MALLENEVNPRVPKVQSPTDTLTLVTTEGEQIVFEDMNIPVEEAAALMGEEAPGRIWNRPAEDDAWQKNEQAKTRSWKLLARRGVLRTEKANHLALPLEECFS